MRYETIYASQFLVNRLDYAHIVDDIRDDGDIIQLRLSNNQIVMVLLIERVMNVSDVRHYYAENSARGIHTLMMVWADVFLPRDGDTYLLDDWMQILLALHGDKIYAYEIAGRDAFFFPVYMQGRTLQRKVRYGEIVNYAGIGGQVVNTLNPHMPGRWYVGNFEQDDQRYRHFSTAGKNIADDPLNAYFNTLGLPRNAQADAVKRAYRTLARLYHPDVNTSDDADERMKRINRAYTHIMKEFED
ncbi:MAG: DnaJ domain-containing protein [Anaerolineae bacterium]